MEKYVDNIQDQLGNAVSGVTVTVRISSNSILASLFSDNSGTVLSNPFTNDADGEFFFFATNETYDIILTGPVSETRALITLFDERDALAPNTVLVGSAAGPTDINVGNIVLVDVTSNVVEVTLPLDLGVTVKFKPIVVQHIAGDIRANPITIGRNAELIGGVAANFIMDEPNERVTLQWAGSTLGWAVQSVKREWLRDVRTADLVLADATLAAALSVDVQASGLYELEATLLMDSPVADDFQFDFTTPGVDAIDGLVTDAVGGVVLFSEAAAVVITTAGTLEVVRIVAVVVMNTTEGTITLRAAKNADAGIDGNLFTGSTLKLRRMDVQL